MNTYKLQNRYVKNRISFTMAVLGCIYREFYLLPEGEDRKKKLSALCAVTDCISDIVRSEETPIQHLTGGSMMANLSAGASISRIQDYTDNLVKYMEDPILIEYDDVISDWYMSLLPDFHGYVLCKGKEKEPEAKPKHSRYID